MENQAETLEGKTITDYAMELSFMRKDRDYWFGQANRNFHECETGHKAAAIRDFLPDIEKFLLAWTTPSFDLNHKPVIVLDPGLYDAIKDRARALYPEYSDLF